MFSHDTGYLRPNWIRWLAVFVTALHVLWSVASSIYQEHLCRRLGKRIIISIFFCYAFCLRTFVYNKRGDNNTLFGLKGRYWIFKKKKTYVAKIKKFVSTFRIIFYISKKFDSWNMDTVSDKHLIWNKMIYEY